MVAITRFVPKNIASGKVTVLHYLDVILVVPEVVYAHIVGSKKSLGRNPSVLGFRDCERLGSFFSFRILLA